MQKDGSGELERLKSRLEACEQRYRNLFNNMDVAFALHDIILSEDGVPIDYRFVEVNPLFEKLTGVSREKWLGHTVMEVNPDTEPFWIEMYGRVALTGEPASFSHYSRALGRYYEGRAYCPNHGSFAVTFTDVTERQNAENELQASRAMLARTEAMAHVGSWERDEITDTTVWSDEMFRILGLDSEKGPPPKEQIFDMFFHEENEAIQEEFRVAFEKDQPYSFTLKIVRQDGEIRHIRAAGYPQKDKQGNLRKIYGFCQDITEQTMARTALEKAKKAAETANLAKSRFLSMMSHELRTPLNGVLGFSSLLMRDENCLSKEEARKMHQFIYDSGRHLLALIDDVLDLSRVETGNLAITKTRCNLSELLNAVNLTLQPLREANEIELVQTIHGDITEVYADETRLRQVLYNLLSNAIKYAGKEGNVQLAVEKKGDRIIFTVQDSGPGIPHDQMEQIFEPFERLEQHTHIQGTGLGLAIARRIVELHGGTMTVENSVEGGGVFSVGLPDQDKIAGVEENTSRWKLSAGSEEQAQAERILVVDDDQSSLILLQYVLAKYHMHGDYAENCEQAVEYMDNNLYHVALLDVSLPDGTGIDIMKQIHERFPECRVFALTAHAMQHDRERLLEAGFDEYLPKPIDMDELISRIKGCHP